MPDAYDGTTVTMQLSAIQPPMLVTEPDDYQAGVCNIGPAEIAERRRTGHIGLLATIVLFAALVLLGVPPLFRFIVALPAALAASGYLQAALRFCVAFGVLGVFNFGGRGAVHSIADSEARASDRKRVVQMMVVIAAIAVAVGAVAVVLPV